MARREDRPVIPLANTARSRSDAGDGSVVAVILLVAITIAVAAAVFLWVGKFSKNETDVARPAIRMMGLDLDDDQEPEWIRVNLVAGRDAGFARDDLLISVTFPSGDTTTASAANAIACNSAQSAAGIAPLARVCALDMSNFFDPASTNPVWQLGEILFVPCQDAGIHAVSIAAIGTLALREDARCGEAAT